MAIVVPANSYEPGVHKFIVTASPLNWRSKQRESFANRLWMAHSTEGEMAGGTFL